MNKNLNPFKVEDRIADEAYQQTLRNHFAGVSDDELIVQMITTEAQIDATRAAGGNYNELVVDSNWIFDALHLRGIYERYREVSGKE